VKRRISLLILRALALIGGYLAGIVAMCNLFGSFRHLLANMLGYYHILSPGISPYDNRMLRLLFDGQNLFSVALLFLACIALYILSVWIQSHEGTPPFWRNTDITLLLVVAYCVVLLCIYEPWINQLAMLLLPLSALAYLTTVALIHELTVRIKQRQLAWIWGSFFLRYPPGQPLGTVMAIMLTANLIYIVVLCPRAALAGELNTPLLLFASFSLAALTVFTTTLIALFEESNRAQQEMLRSERFKSDLITNVSHDIRTPLTAIISYIDLLQKEQSDPQVSASYLAILENKAARLKALLDDLMEASKAGSGNVTLDMRRVDLREIVAQIAGEFEDIFSERALGMVLHLPEEPAMVLADSSHLWRALENLFGNAAKYALPQTRVFAEVCLHQERAIFSLKNTSQNPIDLPPSALTEQFIRGDRARQTEGSGLGLYISKSLIELMQGSFTIRTDGDLFCVEIGFARRKESADMESGYDDETLEK